LNIFNEADHLEGVLKALNGKVDRIILIDGAYGYYPYRHTEQYDKPYSTDGSIDIAGNLMMDFEHTELEIISTKSPWESETAKKNSAMKSYPMEEGDYYLFVDGHEILEGDIEKDKKIAEEEEWEIGKILVYSVELYKKAALIPDHSYGPISQFRILRWHEDLHLKKKHWNFIMQNVPLVRSIPTKTGNFQYSSLAHFNRNSQREYIRDIHKAAFGPYGWNEETYLAHRRLAKLEDGKVDGI